MGAISSEVAFVAEPVSLPKWLFVRVPSLRCLSRSVVVLAVVECVEKMCELNRYRKKASRVVC